MGSSQTKLSVKLYKMHYHKPIYIRHLVKVFLALEKKNAYKPKKIIKIVSFLGIFGDSPRLDTTILSRNS